MTEGAQIHRHGDAAALAEALAWRVAVWIREAVDERGACAVALAGGSTPRRLYRCLADAALARRIPWDRVRVYFGDERSVPWDHPDSNFRMARESLLDHVPIPPAQVHPMDARPAHLWQGVAAYARALGRHLPPDAAGYPRLDLVLLGMGPDGHTASLFPGTCALHDDRPVAALYVPRLRTWRMTLTFPTLAAAHRIAFLVAGADKAEAVARVLGGAGDEPALPAARVAPRSGHLEWHLDAGAAAHLPADPGTTTGRASS
jgi:6-phosphogluconolactonase